jgi:hypothetical protein
MRMATRRSRRCIAIGGATAAVGMALAGAVAFATPGAISAPQITRFTPHLTWDDGETATSYTVQRSAASCAGTFSDVGTPTTDKAFDDTGLQPGGAEDNTYCYRVVGHYADGDRTSTGTASVLYDTTPPPAPDVSAGQNPVAGRPTLTWTSSNQNTYRVSRGGSVVDPSVMPPWTDPAALSPGTYDYSVVAQDQAGNASSAGTVSIIVIPASLTAPRSISAASPTNTVPHLAWEPPVTFAVTSWRIYRDGAVLTTLNDAALGSYDDTSLATQGPHLYAVQAMSGGTAGDLSSSVAVTFDTKPPALDPARATANPNGSISISWPDAVDPSPGAGVASYVVRRADGSSAPPDASSGAAVCALAPPATACTDANTKNDSAYSYAIFAIDGAGNVARREASARASDVVPPAPVTGLEVTRFDRTYARLAWDAPRNTTADVAGYRVLQLRPGDKAPLNPVDGTLVCRNDNRQNTICDALRLVPGKKVTFAVYAYDDVPNYSTPTLISMVPHSIDHTPPHKPTKVKLTHSGLKYTLSWVSPRDLDLSKFRVTLHDKGPAKRPSLGKAVVTGRVLHATFKLKAGQKVYVTLFALDVSGNFSKVSKRIVAPGQAIVAKSKNKNVKKPAKKKPAIKKPVKKKPARKKAVPEKPVSVTIQKA